MSLRRLQLLYTDSWNDIQVSCNSWNDIRVSCIGACTHTVCMSFHARIGVIRSRGACR